MNKYLYFILKYKYHIIITLLLILFVLTGILLFLKLSKNKTKKNNTIKDKPKKTKKQLYDNLMNNFSKIFPDNNRNAGGAQFFKFIVDLNPSKQDFELYNTFYCGVSGSPIDPDRQDIFDYTLVKDINGKYFYGKYYRCCWPCVCDVMKYTLVDDFTIFLDDSSHTYKVLTINDPCSNPDDIPDEVTSFDCSNKKTINGVYSDNNRLIIAILFDAKLIDINSFDNDDFDKIKNICSDRLNTSPDNLKGGMGDIFVKLSLVNNDLDNDSHNNIKNIYGDKLKKCKTGTKPGSWDSDGYCSEVDGGVHQICFKVNDDTKTFSSDTNQSDWSLDRVGHNHCMCLGAWALYKANEKGNNDELVCESIPEYALDHKYIDKWNNWNGYQKNHQIINGVNSLVQQCYNKKNSEYLKNKYNKLLNHYNRKHKKINWDSILNN